MRKILVTAVFVMLMFCLTACGGNSNKENTSDQTVETSDTVNQEVKSEASAQSAQNEPSQEPAETTQTAADPSQETAEASQESAELSLEPSYTDANGITYTTFTMKELVNKIMEAEEAGLDLYNDEDAIAPGGYIQVPVQFKGNTQADDHDREFYMLIKGFQEFSGDRGFGIMTQFGVIRENDELNTLLPEIYFFLNDEETETHGYSVPAERKTAISELIKADNDPYATYLLRCKISKISRTNTSIKGEEADNAYSATFYLLDLVPLGEQ